MRSGLIIVGVVLAAVALSEARSPPRPQACTADWNPVCGVDNKTYSNACMAKAKGVQIAKKGECKVCACTKNIDRVCGVNKVTYDNKCLAKCAGVKFSPGPCYMKSGLILVGVVLAAVALGDARSPPRPQACTADWRPVCGVDNKTYANACMARAKGVPIAKTEECKVCPCPKIMRPVCGVNKVTYDNKCLAECAGVMFFPGPCKRRI